MSMLCRSYATSEKKLLVIAKASLMVFLLEFQLHAHAMPICGMSAMGAEENHLWILPGESNIQTASSRPAAKAYFVLRAAALDCYAAKAEVLATEPVLKTLVIQELDKAIEQADFYDERFPPVVSAAEEKAALDAFLANGYKGRFAGYLKGYRAALESSSPSVAVNRLKMLSSSKPTPERSINAHAYPAYPGGWLSSPINPLLIARPGELPGRMRIKGASARPAPKATYLLYAAALDQFSVHKRQLLASEPMLANMLRKEMWAALSTFDDYAKRWPGHDPVHFAAQEADALEQFIASGYADYIKAGPPQLSSLEGYQGELRQRMENYISALKHMPSKKVNSGL